MSNLICSKTYLKNTKHIEKKYSLTYIDINRPTYNYFAYFIKQK